MAVRSSATAEDTAETSFAGMNESFLNIRGAEAVIDAVRRCWRSLFGARTIYYRGVNGFGQADMDIAVVVQRQIESTRAGVMFTVNPATGDRNELVIEGSFGLGEAVVSGSVSPDRYVIEKDPLWLRRREVHFKELAVEYDPEGGTRTRRLSREEGLRPVWMSGGHGCSRAGPAHRKALRLAAGHRVGIRSRREAVDAAEPSDHRPPRRGRTRNHRRPNGCRRRRAVLLRGLGGAPGSASGAARVLATLADAERLGDGDVLVTHMTAPDWLPLLRRAAGVVTDSGGMTCHAAIVSRELGIPAVVGTGEATSKLRDGEIVTVDATDGVVLEGAAPPSAAGDGKRQPRAAPAPARVVTGTQIS